MKKISYVALSVFMLLCAVACGNKEHLQNMETLTIQAENLNSNLSSDATCSEDFIKSIAANFDDDKTIIVYMTLSKADLPLNIISDELVQYVVSFYMKNRVGKDLDATLNALSKEQGQLKIILSDTEGNSREYDIPAARLIKLVTSKPMDMNYQDVRSNIIDIMNLHCELYAKDINAQGCEFEIHSGFAQYTFSFEKAKAYANQTRGTLTGRYAKVFNKELASYGNFRLLLEDVLKSFQLEGYRVVFTTADEKNKVQAAIPWRLIKEELPKN